MNIERNRKLSRPFASAFLAVSMVSSMLFSGGITANADTEAPLESQLAQDTVQGGAILHCFDWSYNAIKANLPEIYAAGYTAVQTSPVQKPKDYNAEWTENSSQWWKLYQPLNLSIADGGTWLGTKADLQALCEEADNYGIKVIVDVVANHLANNNEAHGTFAYLSSDVDDDLKKEEYYHGQDIYANEQSRYNITQYHIGQPDLNTWHSDIQQKVLDMLKECVDLGVDGFRFDAAKHIELPNDPNCSSDFWPTVVNGIKSKKSDVFLYGEILGYAGTDISNYTQYFAVTDNETGNHALSNACSRNGAGLAAYNYEKGTSADNCILWAESHDTYMDNSTSSISDDDIVKTWAIVGSRADSTSLFLARPNDKIGVASTDTTWKSDAVAEINKFKNHFNGTSEYMSGTGSIAYNERGVSGVSIAKLDGAGYVSLDAHKMADGTYYDQITGNEFTVSGGKISGTVGSTGVAVVYDPNEDPYIEPETVSYYLIGFINGANYGCEGDSANPGIYKFVNGKVTASFTQESYVFIKIIDSTTDKTNWYMTDGWQGTDKTSVTLYNTSDLGTNSNKLYVPAETEFTFTLTDNGNDTFTLSYEEHADPKLAGSSVSLGDDIGINYYVDPGTSAPETLTAMVEWNGSVESFNISDYTPETSGDQAGCYVIKYNIPAKNMVDQLKITLKENGTTIETKTYSVRSYLETVSNDTAYPDVTRTLAKATLTYGAQAQLLFEYKTDDLADENVTGYTSSSISQTDLAGMKDCDFTGIDFAQYGLELSGAALVLESSTEYKLYFRSMGSNTEFPALTDGNKTYAAEVSGSSVKYRISGFSPEQLFADRTLSFKGSSNTFTVNIGDYFKKAMSSTDCKYDQLKATLTALYGWHNAAKAYSNM